MYIIRFQNLVDMDTALRDGPWALHGALFALEIWRPSMALPLIQVSHVAL